MWHRIDDPDNPPPKDGTRVFLWLADEGFPVLGAWIDFDDPSANPDEWYTFEMHQYAVFNDVTHWMPLPPPPAEDTP